MATVSGFQPYFDTMFNRLVSLHIHGLLDVCLCCKDLSTVLTHCTCTFAIATNRGSFAELLAQYHNHPPPPLSLSPSLPLSLSLSLSLFLSLSRFLQTPTASLTLPNIISLFFPRLNLGTLSLPYGFPQLASIHISRFYFDPQINLFAIQAGLFGSFPIIPNHFDLTNVNVAVIYENKSTNFSVSGTTRIGINFANVTVRKLGAMFAAEARFITDLTVTNILNAFGVSYLPGGSDLIDTLKKKGIDSFRIRKAYFNVTWSGTKANTILIGGEPVLPGWPKTKVEAFLLNLDSARKRAVVGFDIASDKLSKLVLAVSGMNVTDIPYFGTMTLPRMAITIANDDITFPSGIQFHSTLLNSFLVTKGVAVNWEQKIASKMVNARLAVSRSKFSLTFSSPVTFLDVVGSILPDVQRRPEYAALPDTVPGVFAIGVRYIHYDAPAKKLQLGGDLGSVDFIKNFLSVRNAMLEATIQSATSPYALAFSINGTAILAGINLNFGVLFDVQSQEFTFHLTAAGNALRLGEIFKHVMPLANNNPVVKPLRLDTVVIYNLAVQVSYDAKYKFQ